MCDRYFHKMVFNGFIKIVNEYNCKPNKLWVDQGRKFYNSLLPKWLDDNYILTYSINNEGKSVVAERIIRPLQGKIYTKMTANNSKSYNSALTKKIETNHKSPKFKVAERTRTTKYKNIFSKGYTENFSKKNFVIDSVLKTNPWLYKTKDFMIDSVLKTNPWLYKTKDLNSDVSRRIFLPVYWHIPIYHY